VPTARKTVKVVTVRPASVDAIRKAVKATTSDIKSAKRVMSQLGLENAIRRIVKPATAGRTVRAPRAHKHSR